MLITGFSINKIGYYFFVIILLREGDFFLSPKFDPWPRPRRGEDYATSQESSCHKSLSIYIAAEPYIYIDDDDGFVLSS